MSSHNYDLVPDLKKKINNTFNGLVENDEAISRIAEKISKDGTWKDAQDYAGMIGSHRSASFLENISSEDLPDGQMYYNIANRIIPPALESDYELISKACMQVQQQANESARIGIKAQKAELNTDRIDGIVDRISSEPFDDVSWILKAPIENFMRSVVDDHVKKNADFHYGSGLSPVIKRTTDGNCCEWCSKLAGTYPYKPDMDREVFRRHKNCGCLVAYYPDVNSKNKQNVWDKRWEEEATIESPKKAVRYTGAKIVDPYSEKADQWANDAYEEIRHRSTDCKKISTRTGYPVETVERIKDCLFVSGGYEDVWSGEFKLFDPDASIAQSWMRLSDTSQEILPHDLVLLKHEILEMKIKKENPDLSHEEAHSLAEKVYNYSKESAEYYREREKRYGKSGKYKKR